MSAAVAVCPACGRRYDAQHWALLHNDWSHYEPATVSEPPRLWESRVCHCGMSFHIDINLAGRKLSKTA